MTRKEDDLRGGARKWGWAGRAWERAKAKTSRGKRVDIIMTMQVHAGEIDADHVMFLMMAFPPKEKTITLETCTFFTAYSLCCRGDMNDLLFYYYLCVRMFENCTY